MTHITSLRTFPTMAAAYDACIVLYARFKVVHKRAEKVDLFVSASGDPKGQQIYEVRAHWTRENETDKNWLAAEIKTL